MKKQIVSVVLTAVAIGGLSGCTQVPRNAGENESDPYEHFNRNVYAFNTEFDNLLLKPVTRAYRAVVPEPGREGVSNVFDNAGEVSNGVNNLLQGKVNDGIETAFRFMVNTTFGLGGLFDVAGWIGMQKHPEDFGQTLGTWGVDQGAYLMLPFLGPSTTRDVWRFPVDSALDPMAYVLADKPWYAKTGWTAARGVDLRSRLMDTPFEQMRANVVDEYVALRNMYLQARLQAVYDGNVSEETDLDQLTPLEFDDDQN